MLLYCAKRLFRSFFSLMIIVAIVFSLLRLMPIEGYFPNFDKMSEAEVYNGLEKLGLNDPVPVQLFNFYKAMFHGDLGVSNKYRVNVPALQIIGEKAPVSIKFGLMAMVISLPVGMGLGVLMARKKNGVWDKVGNAYIVFIQAVPSAIYYLFIQLYGTDALNWNILYKPGVWTSAILPVISLALPSIASYAMWLRRYMVDETNKDYIKLARAKGVPNGQIWFKHVFRNSVVPMVQLIPGSVLLTIAGSIYIESLYSIPGMGGLLVDVIKRQDNTMVQAIVIVFATLSILGLLLGDVLMGIVDPRISFVKKEGAR